MIRILKSVLFSKKYWARVLLIVSVALALIQMTSIEIFDFLTTLFMIVYVSILVLVEQALPQIFANKEGEGK